jgi:HlyD family secretion protein
MQYFLKSVAVCFILLACISCGKTKKEGALKTIKVEAKPNVTTVYYSGFVKPINSIDIINEKADGVVSKIGFQYGDRVKKGQLLFVIISKQFAKDYQSAFSDYIKSKQNLANVQFQMTGTEELKKLKIVSQQEYLNVKSQLFNADLDEAQAERRFMELLSVSGISKADVDKLDVNDPKKIIAALSNAPDAIKIVCPIDGTALFSSGSKESTVPGVGSEVKLAQNLVSIINESGVLVVLKVTELDVNKLKVNQKAIITGDGFPGIVLPGAVTHIDRAAGTDSSGGGVPTFAVNVVYPKLTRYQGDIVRVGMRAEVAIPFVSPPVIKIPISAVYNKGNQSMVKKIDKKTGKIVEVPVQTRGTDVDSVEITNGLEDGDEVVVNATTH